MTRGKYFRTLNKKIRAPMESRARRTFSGVVNTGLGWLLHEELFRGVGGDHRVLALLDEIFNDPR